MRGAYGPTAGSNRIAIGIGAFSTIAVTALSAYEAHKIVDHYWNFTNKIFEQGSIKYQRQQFQNSYQNGRYDRWQTRY